MGQGESRSCDFLTTSNQSEAYHETENIENCLRHQHLLDHYRDVSIYSASTCSNPSTDIARLRSDALRPEDVLTEFDRVIDSASKSPRKASRDLSETSAPSTSTERILEDHAEYANELINAPYNLHNQYSSRETLCSSVLTASGRVPVNEPSVTSSHQLPNTTAEVSKNRNTFANIPKIIVTNTEDEENDDDVINTLVTSRTTSLIGAEGVNFGTRPTASDRKGSTTTGSSHPVTRKKLVFYAAADDVLTSQTAALGTQETPNIFKQLVRPFNAPSSTKLQDVKLARSEKAFSQPTAACVEANSKTPPNFEARTSKVNAPPSCSRHQKVYDNIRNQTVDCRGESRNAASTNTSADSASSAAAAVANGIYDDVLNSLNIRNSSVQASKVVNRDLKELRDKEEKFQPFSHQGSPIRDLHFSPEVIQRARDFRDQSNTDAGKEVQLKSRGSQTEKSKVSTASEKEDTTQSKSAGKLP